MTDGRALDEHAPERILIIGSGGAGKSTFARQLGDRTGLPVIHLDSMYWRAGWIEPSRDEFAEQLGPVLAEPRWIIDGNYGSSAKQRAARAEVVILLDRSRWLCLSRVVRRRIRYRGRTRPDMAEDCPEHLTWEFLVYIWTYRNVSLVKMRRRLAEAGMTDLVTLTDQREMDAFIENWVR